MATPVPSVRVWLRRDYREFELGPTVLTGHAAPRAKFRRHFMGLYKGYIGTVERKIGTTILGLGCRD